MTCCTLQITQDKAHRDYLVYGIRDQRIFWDQGSGLYIIYGIRDQRIFRGSGISILALRLGSGPHEILGIRDQNQTQICDQSKFLPFLKLSIVEFILVTYWLASSSPTVKQFL